MIYSYEGKPIAKQRHRFFRGFAYDPQSKTKNKVIKEFAKQFQQQGYLKPLEGAITANIDIRHQIPKSWSKKRKIAVLTGNESYVTSKPDIDNVIKFYFDVLNKIAYHDDAQIVTLISQKKYSEDPGVTITLISLEDDTKEIDDAK